MQRDALIRLDKSQNEALMRVELRARRLALTAGLQRPRLTPPLMPSDRCRGTDRVPRRGTPRRHAPVNRLDNPATKIQPIGACHICLPNHLGIQNHVSPTLGIPLRDSDYPEVALARKSQTTERLAPWDRLMIAVTLALGGGRVCRFRRGGW